MVKLKALKAKYFGKKNEPCWRKIMNLNIYNPYVRDELYHHGILGQKYGKRMGPPYPLDESDHSAAEKKAGWKSSLKNSKQIVKKSEASKEPYSPPTKLSKKATSGSSKTTISKDGKKHSETHRRSIENKKKTDTSGSSNSSGTKMKTLEELKAGGTTKKSKKGSGKSNGKSSSSKKSTEKNAATQTTQIEMPTINIKRKDHVTYSVDTKLGTRIIGSGGGNVQMTDMKGNAVQGPSGNGSVSGGKQMSGRLELTKEQSDKEYASEYEAVAKQYRKKIAQKLLKASIKSTEVSEKVTKGKEIADKVLKKKSK